MLGRAGHLRRLASESTALLPTACVLETSSGTGPPDQLSQLLQITNGFFAFGRALLVRPWCGHAPRGHGIDEITVNDWNDPNGWRRHFSDFNSADVLFFAEDAFGSPFGLTNRQVVQYDPETGEGVEEWSSMEEWAAAINRDPDVTTGRRLLHAWEREHGRIAPGHRLVPRVPFVLGGAYAVSNLEAMPSTDAMLVRAPIALGIRGVPDGTRVELSIRE